MPGERIILKDVSDVPPDERVGELIVRKFPFRIGRASSGNATSVDLMPLNTNDIAIHERRQPYNVSRNHLEIGFHEGLFYVRDLGSAAGTIVNGKRIGGDRRSETLFVRDKVIRIVLGKSSSPWRFELRFGGGEEKKRMVIADDELPLRTLLRRAFEEEFEVLEAVNGREALDLCLADPPDVVILDWLMPEIDGVRVCKTLKSNLTTSRIPVLMVTAMNATLDRIKGIEAGADDYIGKPFDMVDLRARVGAAIAKAEKFRDTDWLTGVLSEVGFQDEMDNVLARPEAERGRYSVLLIALKGLGKFQAEKGVHPVRAFQREVAAAIWRKSLTVESAVTARLGLGFFAVLLPEKNANALARAIESELTSLYRAQGVPGKVKVERIRLRRIRNYYEFLDSF